MAVSSVPLTANWTFKQGDITSNFPYLFANDLPTEVHRDLLKNNKIENPFKDLNELSVRWIADESWVYRTTFIAPTGHGKPDARTALRFQGLDTYASVYLNGKIILESENMFVESRVYVDHILKDGHEANELSIVFQSSRQKGLELVKQHDEHRFIVHQTEISRGPIRKAQYHWGWDWGPILMTCGPWKPILLETHRHGRLEDVWIDYELNDDLRRAKGKIFATLEGQASVLKYRLEHKESGDIVFEKDVEILGRSARGETKFETDFEIEPELWWPRGYGHNQAQHLYTVTVALVGAQEVLHTVTKPIGFRKVKLVQDEDDFGQSFYFRINNVDIFAGGSCWIPADSFSTSVTPERYGEWVKLAARGNQIMLRVWGGGIYEADAFYKACDEEGILVWQDFMFACANYPAYPSYLKSVELEARQNVRRIRNHPSVIIWAGNNEDYQIVERYGLEYQVDNMDSEAWLKTNFPARYIYEHLLPTIINEEAKGVPYHPSSPFGNGRSTVLKVDPTIGDVHQWNVWHGEMKPYQLLPHMGGRFVSEFGMEAYPHIETLEKCVTREEDRYPGSMAMDFRNKAIGHERRLVSYVAENFRIKYDLPSFTHLTQVMQADAITWAYKTWRRQWGTPGKRQCGGVLVWQLDDCWPTMSWAVVDYNLIPKPAYYAIKRCLEPLVVGVSRKWRDWTMRAADELWQRDTSHIDMREIWEEVEIDVWVANNGSQQIEKRGQVELKFISIKTGDEVATRITKEGVINRNGTTKFLKGHKVELQTSQNGKAAYDIAKTDPFVIHAKLMVDDRVEATDVSWPDPIKYLNFASRNVEVKYVEERSVVLISAANPVKGFVFSEKEGLQLSDNGFDLVPGETKVVTVFGEWGQGVDWMYVGM